MSVVTFGGGGKRSHEEMLGLSSEENAKRLGLTLEQMKDLEKMGDLVEEMDNEPMRLPSHLTNASPLEKWNATRPSYSMSFEKNKRNDVGFRIGNAARGNRFFTVLKADGTYNRDMLQKLVLWNSGLSWHYITHKTDAEYKLCVEAIRRGIGMTPDEKLKLLRYFLEIVPVNKTTSVYSAKYSPALLAALPAARQAAASTSDLEVAFDAVQNILGRPTLRNPQELPPV